MDATAGSERLFSASRATTLTVTVLPPCPFPASRYVGSAEAGLSAPSSFQKYRVIGGLPGASVTGFAVRVIWPSLPISAMPPVSSSTLSFGQSASPFTVTDFSPLRWIFRTSFTMVTSTAARIVLRPVVPGVQLVFAPDGFSRSSTRPDSSRIS